jgi:hypothetical protein
VQDTIARLKASLAETEQSLKEAVEEGKSLADQRKALEGKITAAKQDMKVSRMHSQRGQVTGQARFHGL